MTQRNPGLLGSIRSVPFAVCVLVLGGATLGRGPLTRWLKAVTHKEPVPLRKLLGQMDEDRLGVYDAEHKNKLTGTVEDSLGTDQYLDWFLSDTSVTRLQDPRRYARLFVTYYTGGPNLAPHTPDVCYVGGGYKQKQPHEDRVIDVPALGERYHRVPIRVCTFVKTALQHHQETTVIYTFHANGEFASSQTGVRNLTNRLTDQHAYYSKVEVSFGGEQCRPVTLGREESVEAAVKLLNVVLPILVEDHWPDWPAVETAGPTEGSGTGTT